MTHVDVLHTPHSVWASCRNARVHADTMLYPYAGAKKSFSPLQRLILDEQRLRGGLYLRLLSGKVLFVIYRCLKMSCRLSEQIFREDTLGPRCRSLLGRGLQASRDVSFCKRHSRQGSLKCLMLVSHFYRERYNVPKNGSSEITRRKLRVGFLLVEMVWRR